MARDPRDDRIAELEARVERLEALVERLLAENAHLRKENAELRRENAELKEKLGRSSRNSSKPPSSDGPKTKAERPSKKPTGRTAGGQPGHPKHERPAWPAEKVNKRVVLRPKQCGEPGCTARLVSEDPTPHLHQLFELPKVEPIVTEYAQYSGTCERGHVTRAPLPPGVPTRAFGPSVDAVVSYLMLHKLGKRGVAEVLYDLCGLPISLGAVVDSQREMSEALAEPYAECVEHAQAAPIKNADETSWIEGRGKKAKVWLWTLVTASVIVFMIQRTRATDGALKLLLNGKTPIGELVFGVLGTDRHGAYNFWPLDRHQFCWSHLDRDFTAISERPGAAGQVGRKLLDESKRMFAWWHRVRDGTLTRARFKVYMRPLRARVEAALAEGVALGDPKTARTCAKLLKSREAMWTFVRIEGVEPTNNCAERAVRPAVIYRTISGGTKSEAGSHFVERLLTVRATLRLQDRPILPFLSAAAEARLRHSTPPSLLPEEHHEPARLRIAA